MALTKGKDKLVALSVLGGGGAEVAEFMATEFMGSRSQPSIYHAVLWDSVLASQLLWKFEPVFRHQDRTFHHPSRRPRDDDGNLIYRAPSFSWASVDAQDGNGVKYGEIMDRDLFIQDSGENSVCIKKLDKNLYGEVLGGHVMI